MNTLEMTAYKVDGEFYNSKIKDESEIPFNELNHNSWWYLHGELEDIVGYDKAITTNCNSAGYSIDSINWVEIRGNKVTKVRTPLIRREMHINSIIPVKIEGINEPCIGYFWTTDERTVYFEGKEYPHWRQRGLVCLESDTKWCQDALMKYNKRENNI